MVAQIRGVIWMPTLALMRSESWPKFGPLRVAVIDTKKAQLVAQKILAPAQHYDDVIPG